MGDVGGCLHDHFRMNRVAVVRHVGSSPMARLARMNLAAMVAAGLCVLDMPQRHAGLVSADWVYCHVLPTEHMCIPDGKRVAYWTWLNDTYLPDAWLEASQGYEQIWVPSTFVARALIKGGVDPRKIEVVPPYVPFGTTINLAAMAPSFLSIVEGRQDGWPVVEAFKKAFDPLDPITLTIKASGLVREDIVHFRNAVGKDNRISLVEAHFGSDGMLDLFRSSAIYVTATPFNDVGLNTLLAMANGLPVVAPLLGSAQDFCKSNTCYPVDYSLNDVNVEHMAAQMKRVSIGLGTEHIRQMTQEAYKNAIASFNFSSTVSAITNAIKTL